MRETDIKVFADVFEIWGEELHAEVPGSLLGRPWPAVVLVGAKQQAPAFLTHVNLTPEVNAVQKLMSGRLVVGSYFGEVFSENVGVFHGQDR